MHNCFYYRSIPWREKKGNEVIAGENTGHSFFPVSLHFSVSSLDERQKLEVKGVGGLGDVKRRACRTAVVVKLWTSGGKWGEKEEEAVGPSVTKLRVFNWNVFRKRYAFSFANTDPTRCAVNAIRIKRGISYQRSSRGSGGTRPFLPFRVASFMDSSMTRLNDVENTLNGSIAREVLGSAHSNRRRCLSVAVPRRFRDRSCGRLMIRVIIPRITRKKCLIFN